MNVISTTPASTSTATSNAPAIEGRGNTEAGASANLKAAAILEKIIEEMGILKELAEPLALLDTINEKLLVLKGILAEDSKRGGYFEGLR